MRYAVIMAGGAGTRLWPLSRQKHPKHFLKLFSNKSLIRLSAERLMAFLPPENIYVITNADHLQLVAGELPELPQENLIGEPVVRDTANAVGLAAMLLNLRDSQGVMGIFSADHIIQPQDRFAHSVQSAYATAVQHPQALITLGLKPTSAHTGYGYLRRGNSLGPGLFTVEEFKEKPDPETAHRYFTSGQYFWNSGIFVWRTQTILEQMRKHLPDNYQKLSPIGQTTDANQRKKLIREIYPSLPKISIDYGVLEKADQVLVCEMNTEWIDLGAWTSLAQIFKPDSQQQILAHQPVISIDSHDNIIVGQGKHLLTTIGLKNMVIVHSPDATLICHKDQVQKIKELVAQLPAEYL